VLACAPGAYLANRSAGHLWSLTPYLPRPTIPEVIVVGRRSPRRPAVNAKRVRSLHPADTTTYMQIPITTPARTLLDLAPTLPSRQLEQALATARRKHLIRPTTLQALLARSCGRAGVGKLRALADEDPAFTRSIFEERFLALIRDAGLPEPELNAELGPHEIDALWRDERLAVELDSWSWHSDRASFEADRRRDADLVARGYRVIRVTWRLLRDEPLVVAARVAAALAAS
jgi:very-short-patch-repair endonuclease